MIPQEELRKKINKERERFDLIISLFTDVIFEYDILTDTMCVLKQNRKEKWEKQIKNFTVSVLKNNEIHMEDYSVVEKLCQQLKNGKKDIHLAMRKLCEDGCYHWIEIFAKTIYDEKDKPEKVYGRFTMVDHQDEYQNALLQRMKRDSLTGLYNNDTISTFIKEGIKHVDSSQENYLIVLDVSEIKRVYGKEDKILSNAILCTLTDELQIQFEESQIGRIGEDEIVIFVERMSLDEILKIRKNLNNHIQRIYHVNGNSSEFLTNMGLTKVNKDSDYDMLLLEARSALYFGAQAGRFCVYHKNEIPLLEQCDITPIQEENVKFSQGVDGDLVLFAIELFEKVKDVKSVLKGMSDKICKFYKLQDVVYINPLKEGVYTTYHWGNKGRNEFEKTFVDTKEGEWDCLLYGHDDSGISILREKDINRKKDTDGRSILSIKLDDKKDLRYMFFIDRMQDRTWEKEQHSLRRLAWIMHNRFMKMERDRKDEERIVYEIEHDSKTGIYNYTKFLFVAEIRRRENWKKKYAIIYSDFSNFQFLNETYGYAIGDRVLIDFARALQEKYPDRVLFSRVTSDHFISMHEFVNLEETLREYEMFCEEFCKSVNKKYSMSNLHLVSGVSIVDDLKEKIAIFVDNANIARKAAKKNNISCCTIFSKGMRLSSQKEMELIANMNSALENGEFKMYLQPKMDLKTGKIAGAEALVRWIKEDGTMIYPDEFIPIFEKNGLITKLDFEMLRQVLVFQKSIIDAKQDVIPISVNFSRRHQENPKFVEVICKMLQEYQVPTKYVEVEVTESIFMNDFSVLNNNIIKLKQKGIMISIDDFGSGYSSLNVLSRVTVDVIKVDREFLWNGPKEGKTINNEFLKMMFSMIKLLGFHILAEGVETKEQEEILKEAGCQYAQGYLYAKPLPLEKFNEFYQKNK